MKLLRLACFIDANGLPQSMLRALIAIAKCSDDPLQRVALELLRVVLTSAPALVAECQGVAPIVHSVLDPPQSGLAPSMLLTLLHHMSAGGDAAQHVPAANLQYLLSPFCDLDPYVKVETQAKSAKEEVELAAELRTRQQRIGTSRTALVIAMRTWAGVFLLGSEKHALPAVVETLTTHGSTVDEDLRIAIACTMFDVLSSAIPMSTTAPGRAYDCTPMCEVPRKTDVANASQKRRAAANAASNAASGAPPPTSARRAASKRAATAPASPRSRGLRTASAMNVKAAAAAAQKQKRVEIERSEEALDEMDALDVGFGGWMPPLLGYNASNGRVLPGLAVEHSHTINRRMPRRRSSGLSAESFDAASRVEDVSSTRLLR